MDRSKQPIQFLHQEKFPLSWIAAVTDSNILKPTCKYLLLAISSYIDIMQTHAPPDINTLSKEIKLPVDKIIRYLRIAEKNHFISLDKSYFEGEVK